MIDQIPLSELKRMNDELEGRPVDLIGMLEAHAPLAARQGMFPSASLVGDPASRLKPKGSGKRVSVPNLSPAVQKMLAKNKGKSQYGPNFRTDDDENLTRLYYADLRDDS